MSVDWRQTLRTLATQFEAHAARSCGLHHLFVEVTDKERDKMSGPAWFKPLVGKIPDRNGEPQFDPWDAFASDGLPGVGPGFRAPEPHETLGDVNTEGMIRDTSGVVRAIAVPMKIRVGYFCGQPTGNLSGFKSLANAAAMALAGASDLHEHMFAGELTDIFTTPHGVVRYTFGDVSVVPNHSIACGWDAGVLSFKNGVLIDVPVAEMATGVGQWLLMLHRLGWFRLPGSGLHAERFAWHENVEVAFEMFSTDYSTCPEGLLKQFEHISRDSYYSLLGTKDAPLDICLASAFAIQLLLADLSPEISQAPSRVEPSTDYSREKWKNRPLPSIRTATPEEAKRAKNRKPLVGILVATKTEKTGVLKRMYPPEGSDSVLQVYSGNNTCFIGRLGVIDIVLCMTAVGSTSRDSSGIVTSELIEQWKLSAVIATGIAFGKDPDKQAIGNVLVAEQIVPYEPQRVSENSSEERGIPILAGTVLLNRFRNVVKWSFSAPDKRQCGFQVGKILSGEKLVDDPEFKQSLFQRHPTAIGGEMEGAGVAAAAERKKCEWIVVKAICDWGDGSKTDDHQEFAAAASIDLVEHVLKQPGALEALVSKG
ncbi:MAG: hypothetical protein JW818_06230 [Pirellulales bacterium]|nr:hypothetical protein [Pirellulales bacterium]